MVGLKEASVCEIIRELINREEISKLKLNCMETVEKGVGIRHEVKCK